MSLPRRLCSSRRPLLFLLLSHPRCLSRRSFGCCRPLKSQRCLGLSGGSGLFRQFRGCLSLLGLGIGGGCHCARRGGGIFSRAGLGVRFLRPRPRLVGLHQSRLSHGLSRPDLSTRRSRGRLSPLDLRPSRLSLRTHGIRGRPRLVGLHLSRLDLGLSRGHGFLGLLDPRLSRRVRQTHAARSLLSLLELHLSRLGFGSCSLGLGSCSFGLRTRRSRGRLGPCQRSLGVVQSRLRRRGRLLRWLCF